MNQQAEAGKAALWGVGDQGIRVVSSLPEEVRRLVKPAAVDSDLQTLVCSPAARKIRIGSQTRSAGEIGGDPEKLREAFRESEEKIREKLSGTRTLLIVGGLGGGVASGVIPDLCRCARQMKIFTLVFATRPFAFEGKKRNRIFREAREGIEESGAGLACFSLDRLVGKVEDDTPHQEVFRRCDRILQDAVECAIAYLTAPSEPGGNRVGLGNIFTGAGEAVMGSEEASGPEDLVKSAKAALSSLSLTAAELARVRGVLIQVDGSGPLPFRPVERSIGSISRLLGEETEVLYTVTRYRKPEEKISFRLLAAGVPERRFRADGSQIPVTMTADRPESRQEEIDFNKFTRGIFADDGPTTREGEDLDIPTFVRKGIELDGDSGGGG
jgi:cell division protein FtsZ